MTKKYLLFDLDGTLTDSKEGIIRCVQYALLSLGINEQDEKRLENYIGPPLTESFREFHGLNEAQIQNGVRKYRERYRNTGIYENKVMENIPQTLCELKKRGFILALATSKPQEYALRIMDYFKLSQYFLIEIGSGMNGERKFKADVINEVLFRLSQEFPGESLSEIKKNAVMIGDRKYDIEGAKQCSIDSIGVCFGYARPGELEAAGADAFAAVPQELLQILSLSNI